MRLIEHKTALYGIQIFLRTNIDTDYQQGGNQLKEDYQHRPLSLFEPVDPFTGKPVNAGKKDSR